MTSIALREVLAHTEKLWPSQGAADWDSVGLVTGSLDSPVARVLCVVDVTDETVSHAVDGEFDLVIAHHPLLLRGVNSVAESQFKGDAVARLIRANCALLTVHTNGDRVATGTTASLAKGFGLTRTEPFADGIGIVGTVAETSLGSFARTVAASIPATAGGVRVAGDINQRVTRVAVCAGAGDSLLSDATVQSADVYVTSDLRHHPASEFRENARLARGTALIDIAHWAAEWVWLETAAAELSAALPALTVEVSDLNTDPWKFVVTQ